MVRRITSNMDQDEIWRRQGKVLNQMADRIMKRNPGMSRIRARLQARNTRKGQRISAVGITSSNYSYLKRASTGKGGG